MPHGGSFGWRDRGDPQARTTIRYARYVALHFRESAREGTCSAQSTPRTAESWPSRKVAIPPDGRC
jgi:hypothetical protein